jgi:hypothetical protein
MRLFYLILLFFILSHCSDKKLDNFEIYKTDSIGNLIGNPPNDNQWKNTSFSSSELALFNELDTANLSGTLLPVIANSYYGYPNPFTNEIAVSTSLAQPLNGDVVIKYVVVNNKLNPVQKGCARAHVTSTINFLVPGNFSSGNYRLYFTYSAQGNEHFFKTWGYIQKL